MRQLLVILICILSVLPVIAQEGKDKTPSGQSSQNVENPEVEMADSMRKEGKIYVVVAVIAVIFAGLFAYLIFLDRKIGKVENELRNNVSNRL